MPTCPEAIVIMLATVRIGAIHMAVFAGFGANALADRIQASGSKVVFIADATFRKGSLTRLKPIVDDALAAGGDVEHVVVLHRSSRSPATASAPSRSRPRSWSTPRSPRRASPAGPTTCAARSSRPSSR